MTSGVYRLSLGHYYYIGSTGNLAKRKADHFAALAAGRHENHRLQELYDTTTGEDLQFTVIGHYSVSSLQAVEQNLLNLHVGREGCLNLSKNVRSPMKGRKHSDETREKMSRAQQGHAVSDETRAKLRETNGAPVLARSAATGQWTRFASQHEAAEHYKVSQSTISRWISGESKGYLRKLLTDIRFEPS